MPPSWHWQEKRCRGVQMGKCQLCVGVWGGWCVSQEKNKFQLVWKLFTFNSRLMKLWCCRLLRSCYKLHTSCIGQKPWDLNCTKFFSQVKSKRTALFGSCLWLPAYWCNKTSIEQKIGQNCYLLYSID